MTPSFDQIHDDDQLLDALGARERVRGDELTGLLSSWTAEIDNPTALPRAGRHARHSRALRIGLTTTVVLGTLSVGGVAAAVTGTKLPVLHQLGQVTQGFWGESGAPAVVGPPPSSAAPRSTDPSTPWTIDPTRTSGTSRDHATRVPSLVPPSTRTHLPGVPVAAPRPKAPAPVSSSSAQPTTSSTAPTSKAPSPTKSSGTPTGTSTSTGSPTRTGGPVFGTSSPAPSTSSSSSSSSDPAEPSATPKLSPSSSSSASSTSAPSATSSSSTSAFSATPTPSGAQKSR